MLECIKNTDAYSSLKLGGDISHAYLFFSADKEKNNQIALSFARSLVCNTNSSCGKCPNCKQFLANSHPDVLILEQDSVKVDDVRAIIEKLSTKPISSNKKVFVILNAEVINETAQNKLLKSLEEPTESAVFILTTTKTDKLLPTILSRLKKVFVPNFSVKDKEKIASELMASGVDIRSYVSRDFSLTEMLNLATNTSYQATVSSIIDLFSSLNSTADIPRVVSAIEVEDKPLFLGCMLDIFLNCLNEKENKFDESVLAPIKAKFNKKALMRCLPLIDESYKKLMANVNFSYILDNLLFNILKERFLCK